LRKYGLRKYALFNMHRDLKKVGVDLKKMSLGVIEMSKEVSKNK